jgi:hypothetical protein
MDGRAIMFIHSLPLEEVMGFVYAFLLWAMAIALALSGTWLGAGMAATAGLCMLVLTVRDRHRATPSAELGDGKDEDD